MTHDTPLTPEEIAQRASDFADKAAIKVHGRQMARLGYIRGYNDADQQTAILREELKKLSAEKVTCENCSIRITALREELERRPTGEEYNVAVTRERRLILELEAVKKERDELISFDKLERGEKLAWIRAAGRFKVHLDEAVKLLEKLVSKADGDVGALVEIYEDASSFLSRLSSGEKKPVSPWCEIKYPLLTGKVHYVKCWSPYFRNIADGLKLFEVRKNDREYQVGDELFIQEYDPDSKEYTGYNVPTIIGYILNGGQFGIDPDYCVLSLLYKDAPPESLTDKNSEQ